MKKLFSTVKLSKGLFFWSVIFLSAQVFGTMYLPALMAKIIDNGIATSNMFYIYEYAVYMLLLTLFAGIGSILATIFSSLFAAKIGRDLRSLIFRKVQQYSLSDMQQIGIPSLITRSTSDINIVQRTTITMIQMFLPAPIMAVVGLILAFRANTDMGFIIVVIVLIFIGIAIYIGKRAIPLFIVIQKKMDKITHVLREIITGVRIIRAFNKEKYEKERFDAAAEDFCDISIRTNKIFAVLVPLLLFIINFGVVFILWFGREQAILGFMQIGDIFASIEYLTIVLWGTIMALFVFMEIPRAQSCAMRLREVLDIVPSVMDSKDISVPLTSAKATLEFRNVTFQYPGADEPVLSEISFKSLQGQTTAIIGGTGSGKSTIANLIPRFYNIQGGEILVDGIDITSYPQQQLRDKIGFVPQKTFLFRGTIKSNIEYGKLNATDAEIEKAAIIAQAHDFVTELDKGYESYVSQGGTNLSGGQKQRIAIARAIVKQPEIYVFDDSFSALDYKTDSLLRQALRKETQNATVIIVAQRINTIIDADQIIVLDEGQMAGIGTHKELLESCPVYSQIVTSQLNQ